MKIREITNFLEEFAPLSFQESYDNSGLIYGDYNKEINSALITVDITEDIIDEAISKKIEFIISHHPIVFSGIKKLIGRNYVERCIINAIKNDIAIYALHTNFDNITGGINTKIAEKLGLKNVSVLKPIEGELQKLVTFVPVEHAEKLREAIFKAGAGTIGDYDQCSFNIEGSGSFRASDAANPFVGEKNKIHFEKELRIETIFPKYLQKNIINAMIKNHPYEEVAYDIYNLDNKYDRVGAGVIGDLDESIDEISFLVKLKDTFDCKCIRHTNLLNKKIKRVAVCGGSGSFLLTTAIQRQADIFISGDFKYHQFFDADNKIIIADIGHFESEKHLVEIIYELLTKKFPKFAARITEHSTNPINYL